MWLPKFSFVLGVAFTLWGLPALGEDTLKELCEKDVLSKPTHVEYRNGWAKNCKLISQSHYNYARDFGMYWTFAEGKAPSKGFGTCFRTWTPVGLCSAPAR